MITIDAPISLLVGAGLALATRDSETHTIKDRNATFLKGLAMQSIILSPVILFFMIRFPDWEWNYMFNAREFFFGDGNSAVGVAVLATVMALLNISFIAGFMLAEKLIQKQKLMGVFALLGVASALIVGLILSMLDQTINLGTLAEYQAGAASFILTNVEFLGAQAIAGTLLVIAFGLTILSANKAAARA